MATPTKRYMNVTTTAMGGVSIVGVTSVGYDAGGSLIKMAGDGDRYNTTVVNDFNEPKFSVTATDVKTIISIAAGTRGVFTTTVNDAKNGVTAASGGFTLATATNTAIVETNTSNHPHRQFGTATLSIIVESADGTTNPVSITPL